MRTIRQSSSCAAHKALYVTVLASLLAYTAPAMAQDEAPVEAPSEAPAPAEPTTEPAAMVDEAAASDEMVLEGADEEAQGFEED